MLNKQQRTMEEYMKAGAGMRLVKTLGVKVVTEVSKVVSSADADKLMRAMRKIDEVCSNAEDNMFRDHPELSNQYLDVFYGSIDGEPRNDVDNSVINMAKESANELFERKNN